MQREQQRAQERFARAPHTPDPPFWGEGEEEGKEKEEETRTRRARGLSRPLGKAAHAAAAALLSFGVVSYPGWGTLAGRAGLSIEELGQGLGELRGRRLVDVTPPGPTGRRSNTYRLSAVLLDYLGWTDHDQDVPAAEPPQSDPTPEPAPAAEPVPEPPPAAPKPAPSPDETVSILQRILAGRGVAPQTVDLSEPRRHEVVEVVARKTPAEGVQSKSPLARQPPQHAVRTPEQHRTEAAARRQRRTAGEQLFVSVAEVLVNGRKLADLDAIAERAKDSAGTWTAVVGYLFPTEESARAARRSVT